MKTLRHFGTMLLMALMLFSITSCNDNEIEPEHTPIPYLKIMEAPDQYKNAVFELDSSEHAVTVTCLTNVSNLIIDIERYPWISVESKQVKEDPESNNIFHYQIYSFRIAANETSEDRVGRISIKGGNHGEVVEIYQDSFIP
ncbi:MAG: BACON domain-containing protein [Bacteroidaceae bacterium]|nr:BACON domain-containing protein [Bacteroidaceae bacterium]MBQ9884232.1 BACON domain-containing protein [Bacteroidaceae bacterium]